MYFAGPFSKTAVNYNAGCKTAMSNVVQAVLMAFTLLLLAPLFGHTPLVALSSIIISAMLGLIKYSEVIHLFKVDKFDFVICMAAFFGVTFLSMDDGLLMSVSTQVFVINYWIYLILVLKKLSDLLVIVCAIKVGLSLLRALIYVARPATCMLGKLPDSGLYRDVDQYTAKRIPGVLIIQLGSPIYFANAIYVKER